MVYPRHDLRDQRLSSAAQLQPHLSSIELGGNMQDSTFATRTTSLPISLPSRIPGYSTSPAFYFPQARINWKRVPPSALERVIEHLRNFHLGWGSSSCTTCYMRDLSAVQLTCKAWFSDAQRILYTHIQIVGQDDPSMMQKWRLSRAARLIRLRSTLRSRSLLAALVKTIHIPDPNMLLYLPDGNPNPEYDAYLCTVASVVMACPNLEALTGFIPFYNHTFDRLTHALSTRTKLRQHVWVIAENDDVRERSQRQLPPGLLDWHQTFEFTIYHDRWKSLETLMLCSPGSVGVIEHDLFVTVLHSLPSLKNLCISSFDADDFHDKTLLALPSITSLRLEECTGVTDAGLTKWAASPNAGLIECLNLLHQNIMSLFTLSKLFANMERLIKFTVVQSDVTPSLPVDLGAVFQPLLASKSLKFLHWDIVCGGEAHSAPTRRITSGGNLSLTVNNHLALSIVHHGFPSLKYLRAPRDTSPRGILQSVCRHGFDEDVLLPEGLLDLDQLNDNQNSNNLRMARLRAQQIIDQSAREGRRRLACAPRYISVSMTNNHSAQSPHQADAEVSTSTVNSCYTIESVHSKNSNNTMFTNSANLSDQVSPISAVAAEQDVMYSSGGDSDKEVVLGPKRVDRSQRVVSNGEGLCECEPGPTMNRDSVCVCDAYHTSNPGAEEFENMPPPRSPLRRMPRRLSHSSSSSSGLCSITNTVRARNDARRKRNSQKAYSLESQPGRPSFYLKPDIPGRDGNGGLVGWGELLRISEKANMNGQGGDTSSKSKQQGKEMDEEGEVESLDEVGTVGEDMCTGHWNRRSSSKDEDEERVALRKILSSSSTSSVDSKSKEKSKSMIKAASRLALPLGLKVLAKTTREVDRWRHVARSRGERGGSICVEDFF